MIFILIYSLYKDGSLNCSKHSQKKTKKQKKKPLQKTVAMRTLQDLNQMDSLIDFEMSQNFKKTLILFSQCFFLICETPRSIYHISSIIFFLNRVYTNLIFLIGMHWADKFFVKLVKILIVN